MEITSSIGRTPPAHVLTALRQEVRFHCPVPDGDSVCGNPYLTWHHFGPTWREENHHRVDGMIALCQEHAAKADNGAYTEDQLRRYKADAWRHESDIRGRFDWMRDELIVYAGGNFYVNNPVLIEIDGKAAVWFNRNEAGEIALNYQMPPFPSSRTRIEDNTWVIGPDDVETIVCPPGGRTLSVRYKNGDRFRVEYRNVPDSGEFAKAFPASAAHESRIANLNYPVTVASITDVTRSGSIILYPNRSVLRSAVTIENSWIEDNPVGIGIVDGVEGAINEDQLAMLAQAAAAFNAGRAARR